MKVLYATDGFDAARAAGRLIAGIFRRSGTTVTVVTVTHSWSLDPGHIVLELDPIDERRKDSAELVRYAQDRLSEEGFETRSLVLEGRPRKELLAEARRGGYDLVVVGSGSHSWAGHRLLGSVSTRILHEAPCSVLVTHEWCASDDIRTVLVAVDGSEMADRTVAAVARAFDPARVRMEVISIASVAPPIAVPVTVGSPSLDQDSRPRIEKRERDLAAGYAARGTRILQHAGFQTSSRIETGGAATMILVAGHQARADLVVVGSRGNGPIRRVVLGSVSDHVARLAPATFVGRDLGVSE